MALNALRLVMNVDFITGSIKLGGIGAHLSVRLLAGVDPVWSSAYVAQVQHAVRS